MIRVANQPRPAGPGLHYKHETAGPWNAAIVSGNANNGANGGVATLNVNNTASNTNTNISAALTLTPYFKHMEDA